MRDCCMTRCRARACSDIVAVHPAPRNAAQRLLVQLARVRPLNRGRVHVLVTSLFCICIFIVFLVGAAHPLVIADSVAAALIGGGVYVTAVATSSPFHAGAFAARAVSTGTLLAAILICLN